MNVGERLMVRSERWMYGQGRPNRVAAAANRVWAIVFATGIRSSRFVTVEVRGRRSGRTLSFPLIAADYCGERYLVAMLGQRAAWVANVRAAGGEAVIRARGRKPVHLEEVPPALRAPILKRHLEVAPAARSFSPVDHRAPVSDFEAVAADFPVFRICPASR